MWDYRTGVLGHMRDFASHFPAGIGRDGIGEVHARAGHDGSIDNDRGHEVSRLLLLTGSGGVIPPARRLDLRRYSWTKD